MQRFRLDGAALGDAFDHCGLAERPMREEPFGMSIAHLREEYRREQLDERDVAADPLAQFDRWFTQAREAEAPEPNAMALATADDAGVPSCRIVLLKAADDRGFVFFTDYRSRKGAELERVDARVALCFWWAPLERQVRIEGRVERVS